MTFKKILVYIVLPIFLITIIPFGYWGFKKIRRAHQYEETHSTVTPTEIIPTELPPSTTSPPVENDYKPEINLPVDFFSQAPYADWGIIILPFTVSGSVGALVPIPTLPFVASTKSVELALVASWNV